MQSYEKNEEIPNLSEPFIGPLGYIDTTFNYQKLLTMTKESKKNTNLWVAIGAIILIILLLVWLTFADFFGDTDVAAFIAPML